MKQCVEGSQAIAQVIRNCRPAVVAAYPITPQTHIVEGLAKLKADGAADFEYVQAESEFAAASIVLGASASGARTYTATCSQGLLLMSEVIYTIAGMRLPVILTCANRAISAPINIWNDQQDVMAVRDSGWILLFAENVQEAVDQHIIAYQVAEQMKIPVMVNMDGFILTHTIEPVDIPTEEEIKSFLPEYQPVAGQYLNTANPVSLGCLASPAHYMDIRKDLADDLEQSKKVLEQAFNKFKKTFQRGESGLTEFYGERKAEVVFITMGSLVGTMKDAVDELNAQGKEAAVIKVKCFRPFPAEELRVQLRQARYVAVLDKSISLGNEGILAMEIKAAVPGPKIQSFILGLGGADITRKMIKEIYNKVRKNNKERVFV